MRSHVLALRDTLRAAWIAPEGEALARLLAAEPADAPAEARIAATTVDLVRHLRDDASPGLMESFLGQFGLSTQEGVALMCLAEALLRVPDASTVDALIRDKLVPGDWARHLGRSSSPLVNASTWALMLTGRVIGPAEAGWDVPSALHRLVRRAGEPVVRAAVTQAIRLLGQQFVLGRDIGAAMDRAAAEEARGYLFSYDMLGEAARTMPDARRYFLSYSSAIAAIARASVHGAPRANPGISVKLSALHPRYELTQRARVLEELVPQVQALALMARQAGMGFNIDAEEQDRLDLSLDVIEAVLAAPALRGWDGFGVVVQAYGKRAAPVLDWLHALAVSLDRRIMVRLVKGAYWDGEIKLAQQGGLAGYPVWTRKAATDFAYRHCARKLLAMGDRIYPQFATHNAQTMAEILDLAGQNTGFEFQRLHGMGEALHERLRASHGHRCRIYAPVGVHEDLLAYLVRRLLENGANSSFVHRVLDRAVAPELLAHSPRDAVAAMPTGHARLPLPADLFAPARRNSQGMSFGDPPTLAALDQAMAPWRKARWDFGTTTIHNPADPDDIVGSITEADAATVAARCIAARAAAPGWAATTIEARAACLDRAADAYEAHGAELMALCVREAGKTRADALAELREAVDFLRYYAAEARAGLEGTAPRGVFACISPWNFPLAIFTGQVAAALVSGNAVLAKPAPQTPLIALRATALLHAAGIPADALQVLPGGRETGAALVSCEELDGVCFTGSSATARAIERSMAAVLAPDAPLIAETGGINAMLVDSTALPEQVVRDVLASAFQSAGQRCSALRLLCVQEDVAERVLTMLRGAMDELVMGDPWEFATDIGPIIDAPAHATIARHVAAHGQAPAARGLFFAPTLIRLAHVADLTQEVFGPVLHVVTFPAGALGTTLAAVNALGYGLTLGLHTRVDARVAEVVEAARVGNIYVNRNQIGAVVGVQPFGGEALSGTGPKAGGPHYLRRFLRGTGDAAMPLREVALPGPAGESNRLLLVPRGRIALVADVATTAAEAALCARLEAVGNTVVRVTATGPLPDDVVAFAHAGDAATRTALRRRLAAQEGALNQILTPEDDSSRFLLERTVSVDTTASGGNVALLAAAED